MTISGDFMACCEKRWGRLGDIVAHPPVALADMDGNIARSGVEDRSKLIAIVVVLEDHVLRAIAQVSALEGIGAAGRLHEVATDAGLVAVVGHEDARAIPCRFVAGTLAESAMQSVKELLQSCLWY